MWPDRVSNPEPLPLESDAILTVLCIPAFLLEEFDLVALSTEESWPSLKDYFGNRFIIT